MSLTANTTTLLPCKLISHNIPGNKKRNVSRSRFPSRPQNRAFSLEVNDFCNKQKENIFKFKAKNKVLQKKLKQNENSLPLCGKIPKLKDLRVDKLKGSNNESKRAVIQKLPSM